MEEIRWEVQYLTPPKTIRYCKRCGMKTEHVSSERFRINAQQKSLDIWLIYRCGSCKAVWNAAIYSRINPKKIDRSLLEQFLNNDSELAKEYAMDSGFLKRSGAELEAPSYHVIGEVPDFTQDVELQIVSNYRTYLKVSKILREKLCISNKVFGQLVSDEAISMKNGQDIQQCKLHHHVEVLFRGVSTNTSM